MVSGSDNEEHNHRRQEHDIRDMISTLTRRLTALGKPTARPDEEADHGVRIITIAGENKGATMRAAAGMEEVEDTVGALYGDERTMSAYTNSNYQAVNNSIVLEGSCTAEDPGVHVVISDYVEDDDEHEEHVKEKKVKKEKKEKKKKHDGLEGEKSGVNV